MFTIRSNKDLYIAYFILRDREERFPSTIKNDEKIIELKKDIREYVKKPVSECVTVKDNGIDGIIVRYPLPECIETKEEAEEYFEEYEYIHYRPTYYDCTGQSFTSWYKVYKAKDGRFWAYHSISIDV